jgi:hypothetical protein
MDMADAQPTQGQDGSMGGHYGTLDPRSLAAVAASLVETVKLRYEGRLSGDQIEEVSASIRNQLAMAEILHAYPLTNADEPAFMVVAYDEER